MNKVVLGVLLILIMFGHNYVLNQPQVLQAQFQQIHNVTVPQFNLLYSLPSAIAIFFIIPLGVLYDRHAQKILIGSGIVLALGQFLVTVFGANSQKYAYPLVTVGRILQGTTAQVLYMIQANLSSTWMGKLAGLTLILPEVGQIANVFLTLEIRQRYGVSFALGVGFVTCLMSLIACFFLYNEIKKHKKLHEGATQIMVNSPQTKEQVDKDLNMIEDSEDKQMQNLSKKKQGHSHHGHSPAGKQKDLEQILEQGDAKKQQNKEHFMHIFQAGKIFWLVVLLCAMNECLYFPFLDNAKVLIQLRFCVPQQKTGFYLCLPYLSAITLSILVGEHILYRFSRQKLIFLSSLLPLIGHSIIYFISNCQGQTSFIEQILLIVGFVFFGMGIAGYYSISMPAVGLAVPESIRGTAFACLGFCQTLTMTAVPLISGLIIQQGSSNDNYIQGYRNSSFFFVFLCISASIVSAIIMANATSESFKYVDQFQQGNQSEKSSKKLEQETQNTVI